MIAWARNLVFRTKFLRPDTIVIIPAQGYRQEEKHSIKAMQWIKYLSTTEGVHIQHARNDGEKEIGPYKGDGYYENENGQNNRTSGYFDMHVLGTIGYNSWFHTVLVQIP
jgi:hypothetical protein